MSITLDEFLGNRDEVLANGRHAVVDDYGDDIVLSVGGPPEDYIFDFDAVGEFPSDSEKDRATFTTITGVEVEVSLATAT